MCRSGNLPDITRADKTEPPTDMSFRAQRVEESSQVASFTLCWLFSQLGKIPPLHFIHFGRDDISIGGSVLPPRVVFGALHGDESSPLHCVVPFNRTGCIRNVPGGRLPKKSWCDCHRQSIDFDLLRGAPPLRIRCKVAPVSHTGYICDVACGDESSPLHCVVPFNHTGYSRNASGTAHRPFPTYFNKWVEMNNVGLPNNCQLSMPIKS